MFDFERDAIRIRTALDLVFNEWARQEKQRKAIADSMKQGFQPKTKKQVERGMLVMISTHPPPGY